MNTGPHRDRWKTISLVPFVLLALSPEVRGEGWPVNIGDDGETSLVGTADLQPFVIKPPPGAPPRTKSVTVGQLQQPITTRQAVNATFLEPRNLSGNPTRFHFGTDIRVRQPGTAVYAIGGGVLPFQVGADDSSTVSAVSGTYRYVHAKMNPPLKDISNMYRRLNIELYIPAGVQVAETIDPSPDFPPHLHLERLIDPHTDNQGNFVFAYASNALVVMEPWSDAIPPTFQPGSGGNDAPAVRIVREFDPEAGSNNQPKFFNHALASRDVYGNPIPVINGKIDILARVTDATGIPGDPTATGGASRAAVAGVDITVMRPDIGNLPFSIVPGSTIALTHHGMNSEAPYFQPPSTGYRQVYWTGGTITGDGTIQSLDYIATVNVTSNGWIDTDTDRTRNGEYFVSVSARDIGSGPVVFGIETPFRLGGNTTTSTRDCVICNRTRITSATDIGISDAKPGFVRFGQPVALDGYNFFTPLHPPTSAFDLEAPVVDLLQVTDGVTNRIADPIRASQTSGTNERGTIFFEMPSKSSTTYDRSKPLYAAVSIRCNPDDASDLNRGFEKEIQIASGGRVRTAYAQIMTPPGANPVVTELVVNDTATGRMVIDTISTPLIGTIEPVVVAGVSLSGDGKRIAYGRSKPGVSVNVNIADIDNSAGGIIPIVQLPFAIGRGRGTYDPTLSTDGRKMVYGYVDTTFNTVPDFTIIRELRLVDLPEKLGVDPIPPFVTLFAGDTRGTFPMGFPPGPLAVSPSNSTNGRFAVAVRQLGDNTSHNFVVMRKDTTTLAEFDYPVIEGRVVGGPYISDDGAVAVTAFTDSFVLEGLYFSASGALTTLSPPGYQTRPAGISADGKRVLVEQSAVNRPRTVTLSIMTMDGSAPPVEIPVPPNYSTSQLNPDGRWVVLRTDVFGGGARYSDLSAYDVQAAKTVSVATHIRMPPAFALDGEQASGNLQSGPVVTSASLTPP